MNIQRLSSIKKSKFAPKKPSELSKLGAEEKPSKFEAGMPTAAPASELDDESVAKCPMCGSVEREENEDTGEEVCGVCGMVLGTRMGLVNACAFQEMSDGSTRLAGRIVAPEGHSMAYDSNLKIGGRSRYNEEVLKVAETRIRGACRELKIADSTVEKAMRSFKLCRANKITRHMEVVIAVCLYIACKQSFPSSENKYYHQSPYMLIDFSDYFRINVFTLGKFYKYIMKALCMKPSVLEPSILIDRYAEMLDFGEHKKAVMLLACRIVRRMEIDWITYGRRPNGFCGAALILAGRSRGFHISPGDIVGVVKIGKETIKKRMKEFGRTESSQLSIHDFMKEDLENEHDPPCFKLNEHERKEVEENSLKIQHDIVQLHNRKKGQKRKDHNELLRQFCESENPNALADEVFKKNSSFSAFESQMNSPDATEVENDEEFRNSLTNIKCGLSDEMIGLGKQPTKKQISAVDEQNKELDLTGIDDDEINELILSPDLIKLKTDKWEKKYPDYKEDLLKFETKEKKKEQQGKAKRKRRKAVDYSTSRSAAESLSMYQKTAKNNGGDFKVMNMMFKNEGDNSSMEPTVEVKTSSSEITSGSSCENFSLPPKDIVYNRKRNFQPIRNKNNESFSHKKLKKSPLEGEFGENSLIEEQFDNISDDDSDKEEKEDDLGLENYGCEQEDEFYENF